MSTKMNGYEQGLMTLLQLGLSKREAEEAVLKIRYNLYHDCYKRVTPILLKTSGGLKKVWPDKKELINAYYKGDFSKFVNNDVVDEEVVEENEEKHLDIWDVLPPRLQKREGEDKKDYNKRIHSEFLWITSVENIDWQSLQVTVDDIADVKKAAKVLGIQLEDDDVSRFENGYTEELNVRCSGLQAIAILYYMDRRED